MDDDDVVHCTSPVNSWSVHNWSVFFPPNSFLHHRTNNKFIVVDAVVPACRVATDAS